MPDIKDIRIAIPVFNQLHYTKNCVDSLNSVGIADSQIIIVNNASTDGTVDFLATRPAIRLINNATNLGCGPAWTQGSQASAAEWTVVLNNDVLIPAGCFEGLISYALENNYDIICPAMREGEADYDWQAHAASFMKRLRNVRRHGVGNGVCFIVRRRVFEKIGYFNNFGGYEDDDFFRRARQAGFRVAITGRGWLHHFGSITQKGTNFKILMTKEHRLRYRAAIGQTWFKRKLQQIGQRTRGFWWKWSERIFFGNTLKERREAGGIRYY